MKKMKAAVLTEPYHIEYVETEMPEPRPGEVLIKTCYAGICGSELHAYKGLHKKRVPPVIMGHEISGCIAGLGEGVSGFDIGDRVTVVPMYGCGECPECFRGETSLCSDKTIFGSQKWPGGYAEYCTAPAKVVYKLPEAVSMQDGALIEPLAVGLHAVRTAKVSAGDKVVVLGSGAIGLCTAIMASRAGAAPLICTDVQPFNLERAMALGATHTIDARDPELVSKVMDITDGGCDTVFITAPVNSLINQAVAMTRKQGQIICVAMFDGEASVNVELNRAKETIITGTSMYYEEDFARIIRMLSNGKLNTAGLVTHELPLSEADSAFQMYENRVPGIVKILLKA